MKKGFTLIELLAVIVILAIVALISVPIIMNMIEKAQKNAYKASAEGILHAANLYQHLEMLENKEGFKVIPIGKNDMSVITYKGQKPDYGMVSIDSNGNIGLYMYNASYQFCAVKNYDAEEVNFQENTTLETCQNAISLPELLATVVNVGDYVNYDAGRFTEAKPYESLTQLGDFGGYGQNDSRSQGRSCENNGALLPGVTGWRVLQKKEDGTIVLVHAGTPECYRNEWGMNVQSVTNLLAHDYSQYLNHSYATSASILTTELAEQIYGREILPDEGFYDTQHKILTSGSRYWFPKAHSTNNLIYVQPGGYVGSAGNYAYGVRPIVTLKDNIIVNSGMGLIDNQYEISNQFYGAQQNHKESELFGYWLNWNNENNLRLREVPSYYDTVALSFGVTPTGLPDGEIHFSLDTYLSNHLSYSENEFQNDIKLLQLRGKKIILSIGGANDTIIVNNTQSTERFVNSVKILVERYGLDGIDINIENTIYPLYLSEALHKLKIHFRDNFIITMAPQTVDFKVNGQGVVSGSYYELLQSTKDIVNKVYMQLYNTGTQYGLDGVIYTPGTTDFVTSLLSILLENGLKEHQVGIGSHYDSTKTGYMTPQTVGKAYQSLKNGGQTEDGSYVLPRAYGSIGGIMIWNINGDEGLNRQFGTVYDLILQSE